MSDKSRIEWTEATWNPVTGCSKVSYGCKHCYAERVFQRVYGRTIITTGTPPNWKSRQRQFTDVRCHPERLGIPLRWRKPRRIFVNSMSDLFHESVPFEFIKDARDVIAQRLDHTFQILTKRPARLLEFHRWLAGGDDISITEWPRNVWLGVSVEDQATADERIPLLLDTPAAVRWISAEPLMGPIDLTNRMQWLKQFATPPNINWLVVGGESGPKARPMHPDWARALRDQCQAAGVPFFFKQWGEYSPTGSGNPSRYIHSSKINDGLWHKDADGVIPVWRVGKKAAGRMLDGRTWDEYPPC